MLIGLKISVELLAKLLGVEVGKSFKIEHLDYDECVTKNGSCALLVNGEMIVFWDNGLVKKLNEEEIGELLEDLHTDEDDQCGFMMKGGQ